MRKMRENENLLMSLKLSADLKVATFDLLVARPDSEAMIIADTSELLEGML